MLSDFLHRLRSLFRRTAVESELNDELRCHFDRLVDRHVEAGLLPQEAQRRARLEFGGVDQVREECRDARGTQFIEALSQDFRFSLRMLRKSPGFTVIAVLTLALGIGANTAIFSVLESVLLRSLPVHHPQELVVLTDPDQHGKNFGSQNGSRSELAYSEFQYLRDHNEVFSGMFAADSSLPELEVSLGDAAGGGDKQQARFKLVSGGYFSTLGLQPAAGRFFGAEVDRARGDSPVAVVSYPFWKQRYNLNPSILGQSIKVHDTSFEIIGVAPPGFFGETVGELPDVWVPMMMQDALYPGMDYLSPSPQGVLNEYEWLQVLGRLKPGISLAQANAAMNVQFTRALTTAAGNRMTEEQRKGNFDQYLELQPGGRGASTLRSGFGQPLQFLMALVALVLLIACANVANLLLARGAARQKEFAMRLAVGAGRKRLIRQLLMESLLLAMLGAAAGVVLAYWADRLLLRMVSSRGATSIPLDIHPDLRVLAFTVGVTVLTAILFGLIPSLLLTRLDLSPVLKSTSQNIKSDSRGSRLPAGKVLVVAQVAISLILLLAAGMFVHSFAKLSEVNLGYNRENFILFRVNAAPTGLKGPERLSLYQSLLDHIAALPGVRAVAVSGNGLFLDSESGDPVWVEGYAAKPGETLNTRMDHVGPRYFSTVGIPILMGREIDAQDSGTGLRAAVINQSFARRFFPNSNPIGKRVRDTYPGNPADAEVVGVVADVRYRSLREKSVERLYVPLFNPMWEQNRPAFEVRTFANLSSVGDSIRKTVQAANPLIPPIDIRTMSGLVDESLQTDRFIKQLAEAFGILAIVLAAIGLYGVMAYAVARRTREIGIRMALGAEAARIRWHVLRETLLLVLIGIPIGIPIALLGAYLVRSMLFGLSFADPLALLLTALLLLAAAALAGVLPARRASRIDPMIALRYE
jgi:predicted permease